MATLAADLPRLSLVVLQFPKWTDGRAYSQARLLRARLRYAGECAPPATCWSTCCRCCAHRLFDAVVLRADQKRSRGANARWASSPATTRATCSTARLFAQDPAQEPARRFPAGDSASRGQGIDMSAIALYARATPGFEERVASAWRCCATPPPRTRAASCRPPAWAPRTWSSPT
jgi:hypothetical protein